MAPDLVRRYGGQDRDTIRFLEMFEEPPGARVFEVGSMEEDSSNILAFRIEKTEFFVSYPMIVGEKEYKGGEILAEVEADSLPVEFPPHLTILAKLRKTDLILESP